MNVDVRWFPAHPPTTPDQTYSKVSTFLAIAATLVSTALLSFLLRVYTRTKLLHFFGIDDCLITVSVLCAIGALTAFVLLLHTHPNEQADNFIAGNAAGPYVLIVSLSGIAGISFAKLSIVFFLFRFTQRYRYRRLLYVAILALIVLTGIWFLSVLLECTPIQAIWNLREQTQKHCMSRAAYQNLALFNGSANIATGFALVCLSLAIACSSRLDLRTKLSLAVTLCLGLLSCCAGIVRMPMLLRMRWQDDRLAYDMWWCVWTIIEMSTGITTACLPALKPLLSSISTFFANLKPSRTHRDAAKPENTNDSRPPSPYAVSYSTPTFLSLPRPKPARFHDHTSDLDFDLFDSPTHRSRTHSRNPSNLTMLSNFTTLVTANTEGEGTRPRACSKGLLELGEDIRGFESGYAVSVTSGKGERCDGSEEGKSDWKGGREDGACGGDLDSAGAVAGRIKRTTEVLVR